MKVLIVNSHFFPCGGDTTYMFNLIRLLKEQGHEPIPFAMNHPKNVKNPYSKYFVSEVHIGDLLEKKTPARILKAMRRFIYSLEARFRLRELIQAEKPDVAHLQCIHGYITPSIVSELKSHGIPIVWTLHDYKTICPNSLLLSHGNICEDCRGQKFFWATIKKCKRGSLAASLLISIEAYVHHGMNLYAGVDQFIGPSCFLCKKIGEFDFGRYRLSYIPHFIFSDCYEPSYEAGSYALFFGRLDAHKGILTLLKAAAINRNIPIKIAGDGALLNKLAEEIRRQGLHHVSLMGFLTGDPLSALIRNAAFIVFPSIWYENAPFSILESYAFGKPVIASNLGGITEHIKDGETGFLCEPGNDEELARKMAYLYERPEFCEEMGRNARALIDAEYSPPKHYANLMRVYESVIGV